MLQCRAERGGKKILRSAKGKRKRVAVVFGQRKRTILNEPLGEPFGKTKKKGVEPVFLVGGEKREG